MDQDQRFLQQAIDLLGDVIPDVVLHVDGDGILRQVYADETYAFIHLLDPFVGQHIHSCQNALPWISENLLPDFQSTLDQTLLQRQRSQLSFKVRLPNENSPSRYYDLRAFPVMNETIILVRDTTSEKLLEEQLAISERMASLGTLAAGVAHEINNPLTYIQCNIVLAMEELRARTDELSSLVESSLLEALRETEKSLEIALDGTQRVAKITHELKHFSRVSEFKLVPLQISEVLDSAIKLSTNEIRHRARLIYQEEVAPHKALPFVFGDPHQLTQVFINILINAAQAFDSHMVRDPVIEVLVRHVPTHDHVLITIRDNGIGMDAPTLRRIFDPFFTTKELTGTGLGLSVSHRIVHDLGGAIFAESALHQGTTISVQLPSCNQRELQHSEPQFTIQSPKATNATILVIEDEVMIQSLIRRILDHHQLHTCVSLHDAIALLDELSLEPDAILCDLMLPGAGGEVLHEHLSSHHPHLLDRVLYMTGGAFTPGAEEFLRTIQPNLLTKPFKSKDLLEKIDQIVMRSLSGR